MLSTQYFKVQNWAVSADLELEGILPRIQILEHQESLGVLHPWH